MRFVICAFVALLTIPLSMFAQNESAHLDLILPTDNDALYRGGGPDFYQYVDRDYKGEKSTPWEGGQYGFVRDPVETPAGIIYTRFHEGIDIRCLHRDEHGEPLDQVRAIAGGKVVYANFTPGFSNYGKYIVIEHQWAGSPYFSLYAHLSAIGVRRGQSVQRSEQIGVMGYTGEGLNQARAHLHLELNLMLSHRFEKWYDDFHPNDPNHHGLYNGINLAGMNIARLFTELHDNPSLTIPQFLGEEEVFYKIAFRKSRYFELPKLYPWMVVSNGIVDPKSWEVSFTRGGVPLKIEPSSRNVKQLEIVYVKPSVLNASYWTHDIASGPPDHAHLTEFGRDLMRLLIYPD
jgi:murein DD-endopeptidase MepM/ murein hydrolase activator NlpD